MIYKTSFFFLLLFFKCNDIHSVCVCVFSAHPPTPPRATHALFPDPLKSHHIAVLKNSHGSHGPSPTAVKFSLCISCWDFVRVENVLTTFGLSDRLLEGLVVSVPQTTSPKPVATQTVSPFQSIQKNPQL